MKHTKPLFLFISIISIITIAFLFNSCKKENQYETGNVKLGFSENAILFDTLFTTIGSTTHTLVVYNNENKKVNISSIRLANGVNSQFRINVDGYSGVEAKDLDIAAHDSLFIFVEVTINPNASNTPMLLTDSIVFNINNNEQDVDLVAYGRDAYFILPNKFEENSQPYNIVSRANIDTTWTNNKPIVIYGYAVVDSLSTLTIEEGTEVYFHKNSGIIVKTGGCLKIIGTKTNPVNFQGDRLEEYYKNIEGQWSGISINNGTIDNEINYAKIKNATIGIKVSKSNENPSLSNMLKISNTTIENMSEIGILSLNYKIDAENIAISNCQESNLSIQNGGDYEFRYCSFANYWSGVRFTPAVFINNSLNDLTKANFINCIIYGNNNEELVLDNNNNKTFNYLFDHLLVKTQQNTSNSTNWISIIKNQDPMFKSVQNGINDLHLLSGSAAIGKGKPGILPNQDLDKVIRDASTPDLGAYEFIP